MIVLAVLEEMQTTLHGSFRLKSLYGEKLWSCCHFGQTLTITLR